MNWLSRGKRGRAAGALAALLVTILLLVMPVVAYGDGGIAQPGDALYSTSPSGGGGASSTLDYLILYVTLNLVT